MHTTKARNGSAEVPSRISPRSSHVTKSSGADSDSSNSKSTKTRTPTNCSPTSKKLERRSPKSPIVEKKKPGRLAELEAQLAQLQEDLKKTKEQLASSETLKKQAQQEVEGMNKQLQEMISKYEHSQNQLMEFSTAEESRLQELRAISQDRDHAWQSEIEAIQKQNANEIQRLNLHFEKELEKLKVELNNREKAEAELETKVVETQQNLEVAKATVETLRSEGSKLLELFKKSISELEESKARVLSLEESNKKLEDNQLNIGNSSTAPGSLDMEVEQLKTALEAAELKYEEEQARIATQIKASYEVTQQIRTESEARESELESALENAYESIAELKGRLLDKENELQGVLGMNDEMKIKLDSAQTNQIVHKTDATEDVSELKANLMDKETELQNISEENEQLKLKLISIESENMKNYESAIADMEMAKAKEKEAASKLEYLTQEANKRSEQLETAKAMSSEMEVELRRLRVQSDQWRKAAEAAAAVLTTANNNNISNNNNTNNGRFSEKAGPLDAEYQSVAGKLMHSPFSDDLDDDEVIKKKNGGVLRKLGLWKNTK